MLLLTTFNVQLWLKSAKNTATKITGMLGKIGVFEIPFSHAKTTTSNIINIYVNSHNKKIIQFFNTAQDYLATVQMHCRGIKIEVNKKAKVRYLMESTAIT